MGITNRTKVPRIAAVTAILLVLSLTACGTKESGQTEPGETETQVQSGTQSGDSQTESQIQSGTETGDSQAESQIQAGDSQTESGAQAGDSQTESGAQAGDSQTQSETAAGNSETNGGESMEQGIEIEIFCPEEYSKKSGDVNYSQVIKTSYYSTTCEKNRNVNIVLPDGYTDAKKYPVLYLLHGIFGHEGDMNGNSVTIQNMMTKGLAEEMIVVYPYMYASKTQDECTGIDDKNVEAYDNFINDLVADLMPFIKENYSVAEGKGNTAIAGFSMGGREALAIGLQRPDLFGYVCGIAPAPGLVPGKDWAMEHKGQFQEDELVFGGEKPFLLMVCCGDKDGTVGTFPKSYHQIFERNGVEHIWWEIPGSDHGDPAITSGVYNFCKYVFK